MNRGRGRQLIFHATGYFSAFLDTLAEAHERFGVLIPGYRLMGNHYHLVLQTPHGNLGRVMRQMNGVYTQRYNHLKPTDGPLSRGRYKAILVDADHYILQRSRYFHRNPIERKLSLVDSLDTYPWSSYPAYINHTRGPAWVHREFVYDLLGHRQRYQGYRAYVEAGGDDDLKDFFVRDRTAAVVGDQAFLTWVRERPLQKVEDKALVAQVLPNPLSMTRINHLVADYYKVEATRLTTVVKGPTKGLTCSQSGHVSLSAAR